MIPVSPIILNTVLFKSIPKWISKSELSYRSVWYPWPFQIMFPSSEILIERYSNAWELDTLIMCVCRSNQCMRCRYWIFSCKTAWSKVVSLIQFTDGSQIVWMTCQRWKKLPAERAEYSPLELSKSWLDKSLSNLL